MVGKANVQETAANRGSTARHMYVGRSRQVEEADSAPPATRVAIIGAGDLGHTLSHHLGAVDELVHVGWFDDTRTEGDRIADLEVLGGADDIERAFERGAFDALLMGIGYNHLAVRQRLFERFSSAGVPFATLVHPSCYVDRSATIGPGAVLFPGCVLDDNAKVGENSLLNTGCIVAHDTTIGSHTFLGPGVHLAGFIRIGSRCFIGIGTTIIDNITLGDETQTGGGTVITKSHPAGHALLVGVPARVVG